MLLAVIILISFELQVLGNPKAKDFKSSWHYVKSKQKHHHNYNQMCYNLTYEDDHVYGICLDALLIFPVLLFCNVARVMKLQFQAVYFMHCKYFLCCYFAMLQGSWKCNFKLFDFSGWTKVCHSIMGQNHSDLGHCHRNVQVMTGPSCGKYWLV